MQVPEGGGSPWNTWYINGENRGIIESQAELWAQEFAKGHTNIEVFYEDTQFRIYQITHVAKVE